MYHLKVRLSDKNALPEPGKTSTPRRMLAAYKKSSCTFPWSMQETLMEIKQNRGVLQLWHEASESCRLMGRKKSTMVAPKPSQAESALGRLAGGPQEAGHWVREVPLCDTVRPLSPRAFLQHHGRFA